MCVHVHCFVHIACCSNRAVVSFRFICSDQRFMSASCIGLVLCLHRFVRTVRSAIFFGSEIVCILSCFFSRSVCLWRRCFHFPSSAFCAARSVDEQMHYHWLLMVVCCKCVNVTTEESTQCVRQIPGILVLTIIDGVVLKRKRRQADAELFNSIYHCAINEWVVRLAWCVKYQFWNAHPPNATRKVLRKRWFNKGSSIMIWICDWI